MLSLVFIAVLIVLLEAAGFFLIRIIIPPRKLQFFNYLLHGEMTPAAGGDTAISQSSFMRYASHPFTAFEPSSRFVNSSNTPIHNAFGFRDDNEYTKEHIDSLDLRIYFGGGSTVYDTCVENNAETFTAQLEKSLQDATRLRVKVYNGGVGNWTSFQSYIRLSAWIDCLKPHMVFIYQGINDITPFLYTEHPRDRMRPDFAHSFKPLCLTEIKQNIPFYARMSQLGKCIWLSTVRDEDFNIRFYTLQGSYRIHHIGDDVRFAVRHIAERINYDFIKTHYLNLIALCQFRDIPIVFLTERLQDGDEWYRPFLNKINKIIRGLGTYNNCFVLDFDAVFPRDPECFVDSMHFSKKGNEARAHIVSNYIQEFLRKRGTFYAQNS